jgi:glutamyl-tRNA synthetase
MTMRVRFAPSPTGYLHVGGARAALFNWLVARHHHGTFVLRIEDTDHERSRPELIEAIIGPLRWLELDWDEGPYYQSQRGELYATAIATLLAAGAAYHCDCTRQAIDARNAGTGRSGYDGFCRDRALADGPGVVVRFRVPPGTTVVDDVIRGRVEFANEDLEDFVVRRSDASPVFLVANAVDDAEMAITHAIRGEDLLNTTPKIILLWQALGYAAPPPTYAHLPLLVNEGRKKLSKRRDDVALGDYIDRGYLPAAMRNYLATLGWGPKDGVEIRPLAEIIEQFELEDVNKAPAFFDPAKLMHFNGEYLRALPVADFVAWAEPWLSGPDAPWPAGAYRPERFAAVAPDVQQRVRVYADLADQVDWLFVDDVSADDDTWAKAMKGDQVGAVLDGVIASFAACPWEPAVLDAEIKRVGDALGAKSQVPVRVAVTGRRAGPPLNPGMHLLGRERVLGRLQAARERCGP